KKSSPEKKASSGGAPAWMTRDPKMIEKRFQEQKEQAMTSRIPEFWLADGEVKQVRFCSSEPIASIFRYSIPMGGKRFERVTAPPEGEEDPAADAGLRPSLVAVYEIIDCTGYMDKKTNKRKKNV